MNSEYESDDIEFMLKRCLGLCLTDKKDAVDDPQNLDFDFAEESTSYSMPLYKPLAMLSHAQRLTNSFERDILKHISKFMPRHGVPANRWPQKSPSDVKAALRESICHPDRRTFGDADGLAFALVGEEFLVYCECTLLFFESHRRKIANPSLVALLDWCKVRTEQMRKEWDLLVQNGQLPVTKIKDLITKAVTIASITRDPLSEADDSLERFYQDCARRVRVATKVLAWRRRWKATSTGFGPGAKLRFDQTRNAPAMFELWSFMELARAFVANGQDSLVQTSLLRGSNESPLFTGKGSVDVYYDFHGNPQLLPPEQRVLNRIHVEWFLRNRSDYGKSIVVDTKYKASESVNLLTTLGYMTAFQVQRGVVIFRDSLDIGAFHAVESDSRFALCKFGLEQRQVLCALRLVPRRNEVLHNSVVLKKLIDKVIMA